MSLYLAVELNDEIKKQLETKQIYLKQNCANGEFEDPTRFHITVRFLAKESNDVELVIEAMKLFEQKFQPKKFEVVAKDFCRFEQGVTWIGVNNSFPLYTIKYQLEEELKNINFPLKEDSHKGYIPHITMGYHVEENPELVHIFDGIPIIVDNISLWNGFKVGDKGKDVYIHNKLYGINLK